MSARLRCWLHIQPGRHLELVPPKVKLEEGANLKSVRGTTWHIYPQRYHITWSSYAVLHLRSWNQVETRSNGMWQSKRLRFCDDSVWRINLTSRSATILENDELCTVQSFHYHRIHGCAPCGIRRSETKSEDRAVHIKGRGTSRWVLFD